VSDGVTHYKYYMKGYWLVIPQSVVFSVWDWKMGGGVLVGYSLGRYLDPDIDLMGTSAAEGRQVNELPIIGHILFGLSSMYGSVFRKYHRSMITHLPGLSTVVRLVFIFWIPFLVLDGYGINLIGNGWHMFWVGLLIGLSEADGVHFYLDMVDND
jgi:hypothetical protein